MGKRVKIILVGLVCTAFLCFVMAFFIQNNKVYSIKFDTDGGNYISNQEIKKGDKIIKPTEPKKEGYEFLYWKYENKKFDFETKVTKNMTLKAVWKDKKETYTVILEVEELKKTIEVLENETINLDDLKLLEKEGYNIKWFLNDKDFDIETIKIDESIKLVGKYEKVVVYTVIFDSVGGSKIESQKVNKDTKVKEPTNPTKIGYIFNGWYLENKQYDFTEKVTKNITLKAKWEEDKNVKRYIVTFDSDNGSNISSQTIIDGKTVSKPNNPTKKGYIFIEWQLKGKTYNFNSKVTSDITLKAIWQKVVTYTVSFNSNGGTTYSNQIVEKGNKATNPGNPTKNGYVFIGWDFDFNTPITNNKIINANWRKLNQYTVTFNTNGGSDILNQTITEGEKAKKPGNPIKSGYTFLEWDYDFNKPITSNITINAKWKLKTYIIKITKIDNYSPDVMLSVEENGKSVSFSNIKYGNNIICTSSSPVVNRDEIKDITQFNVTLTDGTVVSASKGI